MRATLRRLSEALVRLGSERHLALAAAGVDDMTLRKQPERVTAEQEAALWHALAEHGGNGAIALSLGRGLDPFRLGFLGPLAACATTVGEAIADLCYLSSLVFWRRVEWIATESLATIRVCLPPGVPAERERVAVEYALAALASLVDHLAGRHLTPTYVHLGYDAPAHARDYGKVFDCPVRFGAPYSELSYASCVIDLPGPSPDARLYALLREHACDHLAQAAANEAVSDRVRRALDEMDDIADASVGLVAERLGVGQRTLHRQLRAESSSYQEILDGVRMQRCLRHMQLRTRLTKEIAYSLGFSDPSNLYRAFRRWTGLTVREYRARQQGPSSSGADTGRTLVAS